MSSFGLASVAPRRVPDLGREVKRLNHLRLAGSYLALPVLLLLTLFSGPPRFAEGWLRIAGAALLVGGIATRLWALGSIDGNKKRVLVTWGIYRHLRHPLYTGSFLLLLGLFALAGSFCAAVAAFLFFVALYAPVVRAEERLLAFQYGDEWTRYCARTWAFVPRFSGSPLGELRPFRLRRPLRELATLLLVSTGTVGTAELIRWMRGELGLPVWFF